MKPYIFLQFHCSVIVLKIQFPREFQTRHETSGGGGGESVEFQKRNRTGRTGNQNVAVAKARLVMFLYKSVK